MEALIVIGLLFWAGYSLMLAGGEKIKLNGSRLGYSRCSCGSERFKNISISTEMGIGGIYNKVSATCVDCGSEFSDDDQDDWD